MSLFRRKRWEARQSDRNVGTPGGHGPSHYCIRSRSGIQWRTAKYKKLTKNQRESVERILHFLEREVKYTT